MKILLSHSAFSFAGLERLLSRLVLLAQGIALARLHPIEIELEDEQ